MRRISTSVNKWPVVAMVLDAASGYGRDILKGAMGYANAERHWLIHEEFRYLVDEPLSHFPECDAAIVAGVDRKTLDTVIHRCKHVVHCSGTGDPNRTHVVCLEDLDIGRLAAEHLLDCRLRHFGFVGDNNTIVAQRRLEGFRVALQKRECACSEAGVGWPQAAAVMSHNHWPALIDWLEKLPKPAGILTADDNLAHDLAAACLNANIAVPDRVAIVGVNNDDLLCDSAWPPLSSVAADYSRAGYVAAELIDKLLLNKVVANPKQVIRLSPLGVVRRLSTEILAMENPNLAEAVRFIREHACDPCDVSDVVEHVSVGRRWLERQFVKNLGRNPHDEIMRVRVETAKKLLLQTDLTLPAIAARCGFAANQNFGRAFLHATGQTPGAYRRDISKQRR